MFPINQIKNKQLNATSCYLNYYLKLLLIIKNPSKNQKIEINNSTHTHINITTNNNKINYAKLKKLFSTFVSSENMLGVVYSSTIIL